MRIKPNLLKHLIFGDLSFANRWKIACFFTVVLYVFSLSTKSIAQDNQEKINWSDYLDTRTNGVFQKIIKINEEYVYAWFYQNKDPLQIIKLSLPELTTTSTLKLQIEDNGNTEPSIEDILFLKDRFLVFYHYILNSEDQVVFYLNEYNLYGALINEPLLINTLSFQNNKQDPYIEVAFAPDSSYLLVTPYMDSPKQAYQDLSFFVFTPELDLVWKKDLRLPFIHHFTHLSKMLVDENGNLFILAELSESGFRGEELDRYQINAYNDVMSIKYKLLHYNWTKNELIEFDLSIGEKWITQAAIQFDNQGNLGVVGFYSRGKDFAASGTFFLKMNPVSLDLLQSGFTPFTENFVSKFIGEKRADRVKEIPDFLLREFKYAKDGSSYIVGEQYDVEITRLYDGSGFEQRIYTFHYDDLMLVKLNDEGAEDFSIRIPKSQIAYNNRGYYTSFVFDLSDSVSIFLFNDHPLNFSKLRKDPNDRHLYTFSSTNSTVAMVKVTNKGAMTRIPLFDSKTEDVLLYPANSLSKPNEFVVFCAEKGKQFKFGMLQLK